MNIVENGYITPVTWSQLKEYVVFHDQISNFPTTLRKPEIEQEYKMEQHRLNELGLHVEDSIQSIMGDSLTALIANKYPYELFFALVNEHFQPVDLEVRHFCLWSAAGAMSDDQIIAFMDQQRESHPEFLDYCYHVNGKNKMSVPGIWHCQLYIMVDLEAEKLASE